jgi:ankyrin repeat protein
MRAAGAGDTAALAGSLAGGVDTAVGPEFEARELRGSTALHFACKSGQVAAARELLRLGASVSAADGKGRVPLHLATLCESVDLADCLLAAGARVGDLDKVLTSLLGRVASQR